MPVIASKANARDLAFDGATQEGAAQVPASDGAVVHPISADPKSVDAELFNVEVMGGALAAQACFPAEFAATLTDNYQSGMSFTVQGPLGPIKVFPPADAKPGTTLRYRLGPRPEFVVQAPMGHKPGQPLTIHREDGVPLIVQVPEGVSPGDNFDVSAPCMMVLLPPGAQRGDFVVFQAPPPGPNQPPVRFRAQVPEGVEPGSFFTARLPPVGAAQGGLRAAWRSFTQELGAEVRDSIQLLRSLGGGAKGAKGDGANVKAEKAAATEDQE